MTFINYEVHIKEPAWQKELLEGLGAEVYNADSLS